MNVALPEIDGRILSRAVSFKAPLGRDPETEADLVGYRPVADRVAFVADLARNWARLRAKPPAERRVAIVLANYPNRDGRIGNGVGLDTPASAVAILQALARGRLPHRRHARGRRRADASGCSPARRNARPHAPAEETLSFAEYSAFFASLPQAVQQQVSERWGSAERDPFFRPGRLDCGRFAIPGFRVGNIAVLIQPARGYNLDPKSTYHDPALVPPHSYLAAYAWLADSFRADAVIDLGKHGTLEWLPGKALALSAECFPGGGARAAAASLSVHRQRSRRGQPGEAAGAGGHRRSPDPAPDPRRQLRPAGRDRAADRRVLRGGAAAMSRRVAPLAAEILERARGAGIDRDCGIAPGDETAAALQKLDGFLCELKELQIRDGLHVLGDKPRRRAARRAARRVRPGAARRRRARTSRCCARWPPISGSAPTR